MSDIVTEFINRYSISEFECLFPDLTGSAKGKIIPAQKYLKDRGFRLPEVIFFQTVTGNAPDDLDDLASEAEQDMILKPDYDTLCRVPWAKDPTALVIHDCVHKDDNLVEYAPRNVLKRVLQYYTDKGLEAMVAPELEFYLTQIEASPHNPLKAPLTRFHRPEGAGKGYSMDALNNFDPYLETIYQYCEMQGMDIDTLNHEYGTAQLEINFRHGQAIKLCDQVFLFKRICREAAIHYQMYATFMAKPIENQPGSSMHFHQSVIDKKTGKNIFVDDQGNYSQAFYHFIGGLQRYIPLTMSLYAPNVNSYRRLVPGFSAPINVEWGIDNRTVGLRIPMSSAENTRIENRLAGVDVNPYIAIAASLAAGYLGMTEKIEPRDMFEGDAGKGKTDLPLSLDESLQELGIPNMIHNILGNRFIKAYRLVKKSEYEDYSQVISSWEREHLLLNV